MVPPPERRAIRAGAAAALLASLLVPACDAPAPTGAPTDSPVAVAPVGTGAADAPKVDTMLGQVPGVQFLGDWTSPACGGRAYARNLTFLDKGEYAAVDLVAPCPPEGTCVWSGLVAYAGVWKQDGTKLLLREIGAPTAPGSPHPTEVVANFDGAIVESGCAYTRGLTVPPGYTEDRVRPRIPGTK